jgi:excisionase family DNA binding protein
MWEPFQGGSSDTENSADISTDPLHSIEPLHQAEARAASEPEQRIFRPRVAKPDPDALSLSVDAYPDRTTAANDEKPPRLTLSVEEAAQLLGLSRTSAYEAVHRGDLPAIRVGRRLLVPRSRLAALLDGAETGIREVV